MCFVCVDVGDVLVSRVSITRHLANFNTVVALFTCTNECMNEKEDGAAQKVALNKHEVRAA